MSHREQTMSAPSAKSLFRATKRKAAPHPSMMPNAPEQRRPEARRRADDFYPTSQPEAVRALLAADGDLIRQCCAVWEPAVGAGDMAREIQAAGLPVIGSDIVDRGHPGTFFLDFMKVPVSPARAIITNPPYSEINARDGHGRWLRHTLDMPGWTYLALLLSWDWPAARANGLGAMLDERPFSWCYLMRWKLDFTGEGSPPQRNAWFVWHREDLRHTAHAPHPDFRWLERRDWRQESLL